MHKAIDIWPAFWLLCSICGIMIFWPPGLLWGICRESILFLPDSTLPNQGPTAIWYCCNRFSQWQCSFHWKLHCHWLKELWQCHVTVAHVTPPSMSSTPVWHSLNHTSLNPAKICPAQPHKSHMNDCRRKSICKNRSANATILIAV